MPSGTEVHIGVYDFHERQHAQLLQRRNDLVALLMYLTERRLFFSINHVFSSLTGWREREDFEWFREYFPAIETRNSHMLAVRKCPMPAILPNSGGRSASAEATLTRCRRSDRRTRKFPARATKNEFFDGLRNGQGRVGRRIRWFSRS